MGGLFYQVLGPLRVQLGERELALGGSRQRALLNVLLLNADRVVSIERIIDLIWGDHPPKDPHAAIHTIVSRLRSALPGADLITKPSGYGLRVGTEELDARRFTRLFNEARAVRNTDPARALSLLDEGLALWRGSAYEEFVDDHDVAIESARLEEMRLAAVEERFDISFGLGSGLELIPALEAHVQAHPLRERAVERLIRVLCEEDRLGEALQVYASHRQMLSRELGIDPSHRLRALEQEMLQQEPNGAVAHFARGAGSRQPQAPGTQWRASFVGRQRESAEVWELLSAYTLVTILGPGGIGKTRLVSELLRMDLGSVAAGGRFVCELAKTRTFDDLPAVIASSFGATIRDGDDPAVSLATQIGDLRALLVLDNCEHLLQAVADVVEMLTRRCPGLTVLCTSRKRLGLDVEQVVSLRPLDLPTADTVAAAQRSSAVILFVACARSTRDFDLTEENVAHVNHICKRLDGIPLALELAAGQLRVMSVRELATRLGLDLRLPTNALSRKAPRHRTLDEVVDWSYQLLGPRQQQIFRRMSIFVGGCTLDQVAQVCGDGDEDTAIAVLADLVDHSMVTLKEQHGVGTYGQYEVLRAYANSAFANDPEREEVRDRYILYFTGVAERVRAAGKRSWSPEHTGLPLLLGIDDLCSAARWCVENDDTPHRAYTIVSTLWYTLHQGMARDVTALAEDALIRWKGIIHPLLPEVAGTAATGYLVLGDTCRARARAQLTLDSERDPGAVPAVFGRRVMAHLAHRHDGDQVAALRWTDEAITSALLDDNRTLVNEMSIFRAQAIAAQGNLAKAIEVAEAGCRDALASGNVYMIAWSRFLLGAFHIESSPAHARVFLDSAKEDAERLGYHVCIGATLRGLACLDVREGKVASAASLHSAALEHFVRQGDPQQERLTIAALLPLLLSCDRATAAATIVGAVEGSTPRWEVSPAFAPGYRFARDGALETLSPDDAEAWMARGALMSSNELLAFARRMLHEITAQASEE